MTCKINLLTPPLFLIITVFGSLACTASSTRVAVYEGYEFFANNGRIFSELAINIEALPAGVAFYVRVNDSVLCLPSLTETSFTELVVDKHDMDWIRTVLAPRFTGDTNRRVLYSYGSGNSSKLLFQDGQLTFANFLHLDDLFLVGTTPDGPFNKLGMTRSELIKAFGRPVRWETRTRGGV